MINASHAKTVFPILLVFLLIFSGLWAQAEIIPFDSPRWQLANAKIVDYLGQKAMMGTAFLNDVAFSNGIIEFDLAVTGTRSSPGILFRIRPEGSWERFYIRPHRTSCVPPSLYNDVVQYVASFNRAIPGNFITVKDLLPVPSSRVIAGSMSKSRQLAAKREFIWTSPKNRRCRSTD